MMHGTINVNDEEIFRWQAVNTLEVKDGKYRYDCHVIDTGGMTHSLSKITRFNVWHNYDDRAYTLLALIMEEYRKYKSGSFI